MFRPTAQGSGMVTLVPSLESRLDLHRRRRRAIKLKHLFGLLVPALMGTTLLLLLAAFGAAARPG
jgi:hypothetical protein